jgi:hypothetical protein
MKWLNRLIGTNRSEPSATDTPKTTKTQKQPDGQAEQSKAAGQTKTRAGKTPAKGTRADGTKYYQTVVQNDENGFRIEMGEKGEKRSKSVRKDGTRVKITRPPKKQKD